MTSTLLTVQDIAKMFSVSQPTVRHWMRTGQLPFTKVNQIVRVKSEDVEQFIERNTNEREAVA